MNLKSIVPVVSFALALSACTTVHPPTKLYDGDLPAGVSPALVKPASAIVIHSIDGKGMHYAATGSPANDYELQLAPGRHDLMVSFYDGSRRGSSVPYSIDVKAGRKYVLRQTTNAKYYNPTKWQPVLIDATDRPNCWTISLGLMFEPGGCEK